MLKKILSYSVGLYAVSLFASLMRIAVKSLIAKSIGKEALGAYSYYMTLIAAGSVLLSFGVRRAITKFVVAEPDEDRSMPVVAAVIALGVLLSLALAAAAVPLAGHVDPVYLLVLLSVCPFTLFEVARASLRGQFDQKREIFFAALQIVVQVSFVVLFVTTTRHPQAPVWGLTAANLLLAVVMALYFARRYLRRFKGRAAGQAITGGLWDAFRSSGFHSLAMLSAPLFITEVLEVAGTQVDQVLVQGRLGYEALAEYAAAFTFIGLLDQPITIMSRVFLVSFSGGHFSDFEPYKKVASLSLALFSTAGLLVAALAAPLTPVLFTSAYTHVALLVSILSVATIFNSIEVLNSSLTIACDFPQANRGAKIWATAAYIPLAFLLVARFGVVGAACSYVVSWGGYALAHAWLMRQRLPQHAAYTFRALALGVGMYAAALWAAWALHSLWISLLILPLYLAIGQRLGLWNLRDLLAMVRRLLPESWLARAGIMPAGTLDTKKTLALSAADPAAARVSSDDKLI